MSTYDKSPVCTRNGCTKSQVGDHLMLTSTIINKGLSICLIVLVVRVCNVRADTEVGGIVNTNTVWSYANSPYILSDVVQVAEGVTLTIEPGVYINGNGRQIKVWGTLHAVGNEESKIIFNNVCIEPGISGSSTTPFLINIRFSEINAGAIYRATGHAIYGSLILQDSILRNTGGYLYLWYPTSDCYIERNIFDNAAGLGAAISGNIKVHVRNNLFYNQTSGYAVANWASYGTSELIVKYNSFLSNDRIAVTLPSGYSSARMTATENYWNTLNTDIIDSMIYDKNDDLGCADYIIYIPFLSEPHSNTPALTRIIDLSSNLSFGDVQVGQTATRTLTIGNSGNSTLSVSSISYPAGFSGAWSGDIPAGESRNVTVTFAPAEAKSYGGTVTVNSNATSGTNTMSASGTGTPAPYKFGSFDDQKNVKLTLKDGSDNDVTFKLTGPGYGEIDGEDPNFSHIILLDTTEKSSLTIQTKGKIETSVGDIVVNGSLKKIMAKTTDLRGDLTVNGSLGWLTFDDIADDHTITIGQSAKPKAGVIMKFDQVSDLTINSEMPIKTLSATEWVGGSLNAPSVGTITITGDKKRAIPGDLDVDVTLNGTGVSGSATVASVKVAGALSGAWQCDSIKSISATHIAGADLTLNQSPDDKGKVLALGKLTVKGWIDSSRVVSAGHIGTISAGGIANSSCFTGVTNMNDSTGDGVLDLPDPAECWMRYL